MCVSTHFAAFISDRLIYVCIILVCNQWPISACVMSKICTALLIASHLLKSALSFSSISSVSFLF